MKRGIRIRIKSFGIRHTAWEDTLGNVFSWQNPSPAYSLPRTPRMLPIEAPEGGLGDEDHDEAGKEEEEDPHHVH